MSRVHDILRSDKDQPLRKQWYLKISDGTIYGPVDLAILYDWAGQSRIAPGNLISDNRIEWFPAQELPELKMEWQARLPGGEIYGPFNVLAVPHLVQNGILPAESTLTNKLTGKVLNVRDILKPVHGVHPEHGIMIHHELDHKMPEEQHNTDQATPLLREAEIQRTIDMMTYRSPSTPVEIKPSDTQERARLKNTGTQVTDRKEKPKESQSRLNLDSEQNKMRLETAEKELAVQKREKEHVSRQAAAREEQLRIKLEQTEKELKLTLEGLASLRQKTGEDSKGTETTLKQAAKKEQDLNRALDETRRKAETDAALLLKTKAQLDELRNQKEEIQNRASQEETKSRAHAQELEKQIQALTAEIQNSRAQYQSLEKNFLSKQEKLQLQIGQFKEKTDTALAELEKSKKELQSQKSLYIDIEKSGITREAAFTAEIRNAKSALNKVEAEFSTLRKQHETLKSQSSHRETELQQRLDQLGNESRNQNLTIDNMRKDLAAQSEECKRLEKRAKNFETESEKIQGLIRQLQEERSVLESKNKKIADDFARYKIEAESERNTHTELKTRQLEEKGLISAKLEKLQAEKQNISEKLLDNEKLLSRQKQENDKLCRDLASWKEEIQKKTDEISKQKDHYESILEEERRRGEQFKSTTSDMENRFHGNAERLSELAAKLSNAENLLQREREAFDREKARAISAAESLEKKVRDLESEAASKDSLLSEIRRELETEREWRKNVQDNIHIFENKLHADTNLHAETNVQLAEARDLLREEQLRSHKLQSEMAEQIRLLQEERSRATAAAETMHGKLENLEKQLASTESQLAATGNELATERTKHLSLSTSSNNRETDLQGTIDELRKQLEQHAAENGRQQKHIENLEKEHSSFTAELRNRISEADSKLSENTTRLEAALKEEQNRNKSLTMEFQLAQERMKDIEAAAQSGAGAHNSFPAASLSFMAKRYSLASKVSAFIVLAAFSVGMFIAGRHYGHSKAVLQPEQQAAIQPVMTNQAPVLPARPRKPVPLITVERTITSYTKTSCMIVFDYGLFSTRTNLMNDAIDTLGEVAAQIKDSMSEYRLIIEGHSDTIKTGSATTREDNYALGLARANRVMDIFKTRYNLPAESMEVTSTGEDSPPFQNTDDNMRRKNRTVVLKLLPK